MNKTLLPALLAGLALPALAARHDNRPNIIYIMTDQQSALAMSAEGNQDLSTPNMDRLAARGARFANAYCSFPLSGPSRAAMFTGYTPARCGMSKNGTPLPDSLLMQTLGDVIRAAGYDTGYAGKWHVNTNSLPGKDAFGFENLHPHNDIGLAEAAVAYLRRDHSERPFLLVASFDNPHNICEYARHQQLPFATIDEPALEDCPGLPANFEVSPYDADALAFERAQNFRIYPTARYTPDDWRRYRYAYYRLVENVDREIGKIIDEIDRQDLWKNTVVIFTSDHGDGMGAHQWNQKTVLYDEVAHTPFIVVTPGGENAGKVLPQLVCNGEDLMPTICDWAGATVPTGRLGRSIRPAAERGEDVHDYVVTETVFHQTAGTQGWAVRSPRYRYVLYNAGRNREMLYDMEADPGETRNLAVESRYHDELLRHRDMLRRWMESHPLNGRKPQTSVIPTK